MEFLGWQRARCVCLSLALCHARRTHARVARARELHRLRMQFGRYFFRAPKCVRTLSLRVRTITRGPHCPRISRTQVIYRPRSFHSNSFTRMSQSDAGDTCRKANERQRYRAVICFFFCFSSVPKVTGGTWEP